MRSENIYEGEEQIHSLKPHRKGFIQNKVFEGRLLLWEIALPLKYLRQNEKT